MSLAIDFLHTPSHKLPSPSPLPTPRSIINTHQHPSPTDSWKCINACQQSNKSNTSSNTRLFLPLLNKVQHAQHASTLLVIFVVKTEFCFPLPLAKVGEGWQKIGIKPFGTYSNQGTRKHPSHAVHISNNLPSGRRN